MNLNQRSKLQEDSPEREEAIYNLAKKQAQKEPEKSPITLELTQKSINHYRIAGADAFKLEIQEITDGGRHREQRTLTVGDDFMTFVNHEAYEGLMKVIPATEHNLKFLASHQSGNRWYIHEDKWREKVAQMATEITPTRNEQKEMEQPQFMPHIPAQTEEDAKKRLADLQQQIKAAEQHLQQKAIEAQAKSEPEPVSVVSDVEDDNDLLDSEFGDENAPKDPSPLGNYTEDIKKRIYEKHANEIEDMKARGKKRIEMTREWKIWMSEELQGA